MKNTFFSSDYHLGHKNILEYDKRPFKTIDEHDHKIISNHNSLIDDEDDFYFIGDIALCNNNKINNYLHSLRGRKHFIAGNHDSRDIIKLYEKHGEFLGYQAMINVDGQEIFMCHFAHRVWNKSHRGVWHLYGHSHHSLEDDPNSFSIDVGVNGYNYMPISFEQVSKLMSKKTFKPVDHHTTRP